MPAAVSQTEMNIDMSCASLRNKQKQHCSLFVIYSRTKFDCKIAKVAQNRKKSHTPKLQESHKSLKSQLHCIQIAPYQNRESHKSHTFASHQIENRSCLIEIGLL